MCWRRCAARGNLLGSVYDSSTGLYYLNARYYEPETRRFITQDSYRGDVKEPYSLNLYAYCANDPVNRRDADGHKPEYITAQGINEVIDGRRMGDIRIGLFGNVGENGCGVIAVYNVMVAHGYQGSFTDVLSDMALAGIFELTVSGKFGNIIERITAPFRAMWNGIGKAGIEPGVLRIYLRTKFRSVKIKAGWGWNGIAKHSTAIITLFKWSGLAAHYVAGVKKNNGRRFKFYNHSFSDNNYKGGYQRSCCHYKESENGQKTEINRRKRWLIRKKTGDMD